jgi:ApbE superfamily uncharacterized protein (UPF0280 family)
MTTPRGDEPTAGLLEDGRRLHLRHGPIDLILEANGPAGQVRSAYRQAAETFEGILADLVGELDLLRRPPGGAIPEGIVARNMVSAVCDHAAGTFVTPMAAVAGAVADHVLAAMIADRDLDRAYVNNGGDISLFLKSGQSYDIGVCADPDTGRFAAKLRILAEDRIGGIATSGWRGRSHSLGICDAVTVLAETAVRADVAATLIANAVDIPGSPLVDRLPAVQLSPDSDLGDRLVTTDVKALSDADIEAALGRGARCAEKMFARGRISSAFLSLQGAMRVVPGNGAGHGSAKQEFRPELVHA